jgi:hypothetical protein
MKSILISLWVFFIFPVTLLAGGIFVNSQQSAEYIRLFNRNAAVDNADIAYYNIGAVPLLEEGVHFNFSNMVYFQKATVKVRDHALLGDRDYVSDNPFPLFPNAYLVYQKGEWGLFGAYQTIGATAVRKWEEGLPSMDYLGKLRSPEGDIDSYLKGDSAYYALRLGAGKQITGRLSLAVAGRFVAHRAKIRGSIFWGDQENDIVIDTDDKGEGVGLELGMNLAATDRLNIGFTYEGKTPIRIETTVNKGDTSGMFEEGRRSHLDLPQILRLGVSFQGTPKLRTEINMNIYLEDHVNFSYLNNALTQVDYQRDYKNTYELGACGEYRIDSRWLVSSGMVYNWIGQEKSSTVDVSVPGGHADYVSIGAGAQLTVIPSMKLNVGVAHTRFLRTYESTDRLFAIPKEYNKEYFIIATGIDYRF